jgi:hypothetical protein
VLLPHARPLLTTPPPLLPDPCSPRPCRIAPAHARTACVLGPRHVLLTPPVFCSHGATPRPQLHLRLHRVPALSAVRASTLLRHHHPRLPALLLNPRTCSAPVPATACSPVAQRLRSSAVSPELRRSARSSSPARELLHHLNRAATAPVLTRRQLACVAPRQLTPEPPACSALAPPVPRALLQPTPAPAQSTASAPFLGPPAPRALDSATLARRQRLRSAPAAPAPAPPAAAACRRMPGPAPSRHRLESLACCRSYALPPPSACCRWIPSRAKVGSREEVPGLGAGQGKGERGAWKRIEQRKKKNRGEREIGLPKDLCVILENCRDLSVKHNFSSI